MKKIISFILAMVMALSVMVVAFAADETITVGKEKTVIVKSDQDCVITFTAPKDGVYSLSASCSGSFTEDEYVYFDLVNDKSGDECAISFYEICHSQNVNDDKYNRSFIVKKGEKYDINISAYNHRNIVQQTVLKLLISEKKYPDIYIGKTNFKTSYSGNLGKSGYFIFTPDKDGFYNFKTNTPKTDLIDFSFYLYGTSGLLTYNPFGGSEGAGDFDLSHYLYAGEKYLIYTSGCLLDGKDEVTEYTLDISHGTKKEVKEIFFDLYSTPIYEPVELRPGETNSMEVRCSPYGSQSMAGITAKSSNEKVATVEYRASTGMATIHGNGVGRTRITFTTDNGKKLSVDFVIHSDLYLFLRNILWDIRDFFYNLFNV